MEVEAEAKQHINESSKQHSRRRKKNFDFIPSRLTIDMSFLKPPHEQRIQYELSRFYQQ